MISIVVVSLILFLVTFPAGKAILSVAGKNTNLPLTDYLFTGAAIINTVLTIYSVFLPTGYWPAVVLLIISVITGLVTKWYQDLSKSKVELKTIGILALFGLLISILAADGPRNGDSISYHIPAIRWIQEYAVVPGLGNLHGRFAFNPNIFNLMAGFTFAGITGFPIYAVNAFFCFFFFWYLHSLYTKRNDFSGGTQFFFLIIAILSIQYMMLRLSSPTPDLVAGLLSLYIFMRFTEYNFKNSGTAEVPAGGFILVLTILATYLFTVKLSTVFIVLIPLILLWKFKNQLQLKQYLILGACSLSLAIPWLVRNYYLGGYLVFPSTIPDLFNPDWKVPVWAVEFDKNIIHNWAKWPSTGSQKVENMPVSEWLPFWFSQLSAFWKVFLCFCLVSPVLVIALYLKRRNEKRYDNFFVMWLASLSGVIFWFFSAPDPRFGFPFLVIFGLSFLLFLKPGIESKPRIRIALSLTAAFFLLISLGYPLKGVIGLRKQLSKIVVKSLPVETYATEQVLHDVDQYSVEKVRIDPDFYPVCKSYIESIFITGRSDEFELVFRGQSIQDGFRMQSTAN